MIVASSGTEGILGGREEVLRRRKRLKSGRKKKKKKGRLRRNCIKLTHTFNKIGQSSLFGDFDGRWF